MELKELVGLTEQWFVDRGLDKSDPSKQMLKLYEEFGELSGAYLDGYDKSTHTFTEGFDECVQDAIGDMIIVMIGLSKQIGIKTPIGYYVMENPPSDTDRLIAYIVKDLGFVSEAIAKNKGKDSAFVQLGMFDLTLRELAVSLGMDYKECLELAYNEIKDRKGKLINGVFVKEEDLHEG